jgi:hypothetical protein
VVEGIQTIDENVTYKIATIIDAFIINDSLQGKSRLEELSQIEVVMTLYVDHYEILNMPYNEKGHLVYPIFDGVLWGKIGSLKKEWKCGNIWNFNDAVWVVEIVFFEEIWIWFGTASSEFWLVVESGSCYASEDVLYTVHWFALLL